MKRSDPPSSSADGKPSRGPPWQFRRLQTWSSGDEPVKGKHKGFKHKGCKHKGSSIDLDPQHHGQPVDEAQALTKWHEMQAAGDHEEDNLGVVKGESGHKRLWIPVDELRYRDEFHEQQQSQPAQQHHSQPVDEALYLATAAAVCVGEAEVQTQHAWEAARAATRAAMAARKHIEALIAVRKADTGQ